MHLLLSVYQCDLLSQRCKSKLMEFFVSKGNSPFRQLFWEQVSPNRGFPLTSCSEDNANSLKKSETKVGR